MIDDAFYDIRLAKRKGRWASLYIVEIVRVDEMAHFQKSSLSFSDLREGMNICLSLSLSRYDMSLNFL